MRRHLSYLSLLIPLSFVVFCDVNWQPAIAQENLGINKVATAKLLKSKDGVELATTSKASLPRPIIQYLSGENGNTVLVADFPGLIWDLPTKSVAMETFGTTSSITSIKMGRFQASPPVCRVSISARNASVLSTVAFRATPGRLTIKIPSLKSGNIGLSRLPGNSQVNAAYGAGSLPYAPPIGKTTPQRAGIAPPLSSMDPSLAGYQGPGKFELDPDVISQSATDNGSEFAKAPLPGRQFAPKLKTLAQKPMSAPVFAPARTASKQTEKPTETQTNNPAEKSAKSGSMSKLLGKLKDKTAKLFSPEADSSTLADAAESSDAVSKRAETSDIKLRLDGQQIELSGIKAPANRITYKTFRLSNPDRYVIDFDNLPELADAEKPEFPENKFIKDIRFGLIQANDNEGAPAKGRLVFDLFDPETTFNINSDSNKIVFSINSLPSGLPASTAELKGKVIVLDAGHGGTDPGAQRGVTNEKDITLSVVKYLSEFLKAQGVKVFLTRTDDTFISLQERVDITNRTSPNAFISVHVNAMESSNDITGLETYYQTEQSRELAGDIHKNLLDTLRVPDRNIRKAKFYVINRTEVPSVLAEIGFISNQDEREKLISSDYQRQVAEGLAKGIILYLSSDSASRDISHRTSAEKTKVATQSNSASPKKISGTAKAGNEKIKAGTLSSLSRLAQKGLGIGMSADKDQAQR